VALAITSITFDKPVYNPGDVITLTVDYTSTDLISVPEVTSTATVELTDAAGSTSGTSDFLVQPAGTEPEPTTAVVTDNRGGAWALVSNAFTGTTAPFPGVAVLTSAA